jgi:hypothetical protein
MSKPESGIPFDWDPIPDPPIEECPVKPLAHFDGFVVFSTPADGARIEAAADVEDLIWIDILNWPGWHDFQTYWLDASGKLRSQAAATWLVRKCREAEFWDGMASRHPTPGST